MLFLHLYFEILLTKERLLGCEYFPQFEMSSNAH